MSVKPSSNIIFSTDSPGKNVQRSKRADKEGVDQKNIKTLPVHKKNKIPEVLKKKKKMNKNKTQINARDVAQKEKNKWIC